MSIIIGFDLNQNAYITLNLGFDFKMRIYFILKNSAEKSIKIKLYL